MKDEEVEEDTEEWDGRGNLIPVQHHVEHHQVRWIDRQIDR